MAGRHRKPPAWRRLLTALSRSRHDAPRAAGARTTPTAGSATAALQAEVAALRETVATLREQLAEARAAAVAAPSPAAQWRLPLVADLSADRTIELPERPLLDPRLARAAELVDQLFAGEPPAGAARPTEPAPVPATPAAPAAPAAEESRPAA